jgi:hypothetical protein
VPSDSWAVEGLKLVPQIIGVLWSGLVATIAIMFSLMRDEDLDKLHHSFGDGFLETLMILKSHVIVIFLSLIISLMSFYLEFPFINQILNYFLISSLSAFYFIQIFFLLVTAYSTLEILNSLFILFEIKFRLITKPNKK